VGNKAPSFFHHSFVACRLRLLTPIQYLPPGGRLKTWTGLRHQSETFSVF